MKKIYLALVFSLFISGLGVAQTVVLSDNFTSYDSTSGSSYNGWTLSYFGFGSYYTSSPAPAGSAGPSGPNSYKFGRDSATATTPMFMGGGDSVHFFMKGNPASGLTLGNSTFYVYESSNGTTWTSVHTFNPPMDTAKVGSMQHFPLLSSSMFLKFFYDKDIGNVAFDDFSITKNSIGINSISAEDRVSIFPTPTSGKININFGNLMQKANFSVMNMLGKQVLNENMSEADDAYSLNLTSLQNGIYFLQVKSDKLSLTKRIIVKH